MATITTMFLFCSVVTPGGQNPGLSTGVEPVTYTLLPVRDFCNELTNCTTEAGPSM